MSERDYVLGTHDAEIERLGLQHRVWRARALDAFDRAGIGRGQTVIDVGAGPGFVTQDLAEIVGPVGRVVAVERSARFLDMLSLRMRRGGLANVEAIEADIVDGPLPETGADALWCRWVMCFVADPRAALRNMLSSLRPGGVAVFHEYADYETWRLMPRRAALEDYVEAVMTSWRATGGEPDIALDLPSWLIEEGYAVEVRPFLDVVRPASFTWEWLSSFVDAGGRRLAELGYLTPQAAEAACAAVAAAAADGASRMVTPLVLEIIARRS